MNKTLCVIAAHTSSDMHINAACSNIKYLLEIADKVVIVNSKDFEVSDRLKEKITSTYPDVDIQYKYCHNYVNLCHGKWCHYLENFYNYDYEHVLLTNDSFLVINSLKPFKDLHSSKEYEMTGLVSSREGRWHCQDWMRLYRNSSIKTLTSFYQECAAKYNHFKLVSEVDNVRRNHHYSWCVRAEIDSTQLFSPQACLYTLPLGYKSNIHFDNEMLEEYIVNKKYPVVKLKKLNYTIYDEDYSKELPDDFDTQQYKFMNPDLQFNNKTHLEQHFMNHGCKEGRLYKCNQKVVIPNYIKQAVKKELLDYE